MFRAALAACDVHMSSGRDARVFLTQLARLLAEHDTDVTIITIQSESRRVRQDLQWREQLRSWGVELIEVGNKPAAANRFPDVWLVRASEQVSTLLPGFDVVYFCDRANVAFHTLRVKRFTTAAMPVCVTFIQGPSSLVRSAKRAHPQVPEDLNLDFVERYGAEHSDFVVASCRSMLGWVRSNGWRPRGEPVVLGSPYRPPGALALEGHPEQLRRLVYFDPTDDPASFQLFVTALWQLSDHSPATLRALEEIVVFGQRDRMPPHSSVIDEASGSWSRRLDDLGLRVKYFEKEGASEATDYLAAHVQDALAVLPGRSESLSYGTIEASLIPGLNMICARGGGNTDLFDGRGDDQLFEPFAPALGAKITERLAAPLAHRQLVRFDFKAANERWLELHERIRAGKRIPGASPTVSVESRALGTPIEPPAPPAVDICITYFNKAKHFPQLLESLERQTTQNFRVIAVDDGSTDENARAVFDQMAAQYRPRDWTFFRQANRFVDAARNEAARHARAEFLLMLDADDVLARNALERLLTAARVSSDDCLVSASCLFPGDTFPYDPDTGALTVPIFGYYMPLGPSLVAGLFEPVVFGVSAILIRRAVFEAIGGYREVRGAIHEDWELHARLALAGYKVDVVPEYLHFHRQRNDGLSRTGDEFLARRRMAEAYDDHMGSIGLRGAASAISGLYRHCLELERAGREAESRLGLREGRFELIEPRKINPSIAHPFKSEFEGPRLIRILRRRYRRAVPLDVRLRLHGRLMKLIGRDPVA